MKNSSLLELALEESPIARLVVDANGILAFANQRARTLFSIDPGDAGRPLKDLEIAYRPVELRSLIEQAHAARRSITRSGIERRFGDGERQVLDLEVMPILEPGGRTLGVSLTYLDVTRFSALEDELRKTRQEVQSANEELQSSNEELETTNEELQSSNEELETTNEELQSTNEELETMNEELQSTNEELQTVNEELRQRTEEVNQANAFLESVLGSLRSGAIVVNQNLDVLVWNAGAEELWGVRAKEVHRKSLLNLDIGLPMEDLRNVIRPCLNGDGGSREVVLDAVNRRGKKIRCRVSCAPLVSPRGQRDGAILMMDEV